MNKTKKPVKKKRQRCGKCGPCKVKENCGTCGNCVNPKRKQACIKKKCEQLRHAEPDPQQPLLTSFLNRSINSTQSSTSSTDTSRPTSRASTSQDSRQPTPELQNSGDIVRNLIADVEHVSETRSSTSEEQSSSTLEGQVRTRGQLEQKAKSDQLQMPESGINQNQTDQQQSNSDSGFLLQTPKLTRKSNQSKKVQNNAPTCQSDDVQHELLDYSAIEEPRLRDQQNGDQMSSPLPMSSPDLTSNAKELWNSEVEVSPLSVSESSTRKRGRSPRAENRDEDLPNKQFISSLLDYSAIEEPHLRDQQNGDQMSSPIPMSSPDLTSNAKELWNSEVEVSPLSVSESSTRKRGRSPRAENRDEDLPNKQKQKGSSTTTDDCTKKDLSTKHKSIDLQPCSSPENQKKMKLDGTNDELPEEFDEYQNSPNTSDMQTASFSACDVIDDSKRSYTNVQKRNLASTISMRVFMAGEYCGGKTSLAQSLCQNLDGEYVTRADDRTIVVNFNTWVIQNDTTALIYDIGGHRSYEYVSHFFHASEANNVGIIVHDINLSEKEDYAKTFRWVKDIITHSPKCQCKFVLTKIDRLSEKEVEIKREEFNQEMVRLLGDEISIIKEKFGKKLPDAEKEMVKGFGKIKKDIKSVYTISCKRKADPGLKKLKEDLKTISTSNKKKHKMPDRWQMFYRIMGKLGVCGQDDEADETNEAQLETNTEKKLELTVNSSHDEISQMNSSEMGSFSSSESPPEDEDSSHHETKLGKIDFNDAFEQFCNIEVKDKLEGKNEKLKRKDFEKCLKKLNNLGLLIWFDLNDTTKRSIYNDLEAFAVILKVIFHHNIKSLTFEKLSTDQRRIYDAMKDKFNADLEQLKTKAIMPFRLLEALLQPYVCEHSADLKNEVEVLTEILKELCICFPVHKNEMFIPWYAPEQPETDLDTPDLEVLKYEVKVTGYIPAALFHMLCTSLWKHVGIIPSQKRNFSKNELFVQNGDALKIKMCLKEGDGITLTQYVDLKHLTELRNNRKTLRKVFLNIRFASDELKLYRKSKYAGLYTGIGMVCPICDECHEWDLEEHLKTNCVVIEKVPDTSTCATTGENYPMAYIHPLPKEQVPANLCVKQLLKYLSDKKFGKKKGKPAKKTPLRRTNLQRNTRSSGGVSAPDLRGLFSGGRISNALVSKKQHEMIIHLMKFICKIVFPGGTATGSLLGFILDSQSNQKHAVILTNKHLLDMGLQNGMANQPSQCVANFNYHSESDTLRSYIIQETCYIDSELDFMLLKLQFNGELNTDFNEIRLVDIMTKTLNTVKGKLTLIWSPIWKHSNI